MSRRPGLVAAAPTRRRPGPVALATDWIAAARGQLASLGPESPDRYRSGEGVPVVAIPGVYETWHFLRPVMRALHERGHPVHVIDDLGRNQRPVVDGARRLADLLVARGITDAVVVAHSKGGLIAKYAMTQLDPERRIDRLVAVASPFGGSLYARFGPVPSLRAFRASDPTIAALVAEVTVNARITSIYGAADTLIPEGSELVGATNVRLPVVGHFAILSDPRVVRAVVDAVDTP